MKLLVKLATLGKLQNQVYSISVVEIAKETQNVGVAKMCLDFYLATKLVLYSCFLELGLK